jgi:hypothetical protein
MLTRNDQGQAGMHGMVTSGDGQEAPKTIYPFLTCEGKFLRQLIPFLQPTKLQFFPFIVQESKTIMITWGRTNLLRYCLGTTSPQVRSSDRPDPSNESTSPLVQRAKGIPITSAAPDWINTGLDWCNIHYWNAWHELEEKTNNWW